VTKVAERTKVCNGCQTTKPWSAFRAKTRWPDGTVRRVESRCITCRNAAARARMARHHDEHPDARGERMRAFRERVAQAQRVIDREPEIYLDPVPFLAWLRDHRRGWLLDGRQPLAHRLGVDESKVRRWEAGVAIRLSLMDEILVRIDEPFLLRELWPHLYE
jgi:hypothetical protein